VMKIVLPVSFIFSPFGSGGYRCVGIGGYILMDAVPQWEGARAA
jgi:hypothetical protein